jgi:uncharacterized protein (DUF305 family)
MSSFFRAAILAFGLATTSSVVLGQGTTDRDTHHPADQIQRTEGSRAIMSHMHEQMMEAPLTGDPDHDFTVLMIPHHQGAIDMAREELKHGSDPELRKLAEKIINGQAVRPLE